MANPRSSAVSRRKPASVTNLEIKDRSRSALNSLCPQLIFEEIEDIQSNQSTASSGRCSNEEGEISTTKSCFRTLKGEVIGAPKYLDSNYQTWRLLNSVIEGQWNDAQESLSLGADLSFLTLLKDQTCRQELAGFVAKVLGAAGTTTQCQQQQHSPPLVDGAKQPLVYVDQNSDAAIMMENNIKATSTEGNSVLRAVFTKAIDGLVKQWFRWGLATVNLGLELCQAVTTQEAAAGKIKGTGRSSLTLSTLLSSICLILTIWEIGHEMRKEGVKWKKRGSHYFFYYPGKDAPVYGSFTTWFGLIISIVQFGVNCMSLVTKTTVIKFDYLALLFSACYLVWTASSSWSSKQGGERTVVGVVKCENSHDKVEGRLVHGSWVFECVQCKMDKVV